MQRTERSVLGFYSTSMKNLLGTKGRAALHRDRRYRIGGHEAVLPPGHRLPWFQSVFPHYDTYAQSVLRKITRGSHRPLLIDIGANVGDTTLLAIEAVPNLQVRAVEGSPFFADYLTRNTAHLGPQVEVIKRFVFVDGAQSLTYSHNLSTGGFQPASHAADAGPDSVTISALLDDLDSYDLTIWKSDTDGLDIPILLSDWTQITAACAAIWFEFDPFRDVNDAKQLPELCNLIAKSGRHMHIVDNTGRSMMTVPAEVANEVLTGLTQWLANSAVPGDTSYLDIWLLDPALTHPDPTSGLLSLGPRERNSSASVD